MKHTTKLIRDAGRCFANSSPPSLGYPNTLYSTATTPAPSPLELVKGIEDIPSPPGFPLLQNVPNFLYNMDRIHLYCKELTQRYGNIFKLRVPGKGADVVFVSDPLLFSQILANDGKQPVNMAFDTSAYIRNHDLKDRYPTTTGLFAHGPDWLKFRQAVQQDMMRPKAALYYLKEINSVMDAFQTHIESVKSPEDATVHDILNLSKQFALESIGVIFLGKRFNILEGNSQGLELQDANSRFMTEFMSSWYLPAQLSKKYTSHYSKMVEASRDMVDITDECIQEFIQKSKSDSTLKDTVLGKLISRSGVEVASVMAQDAMLAGSDTTGISAAFLLLNVASNPQAQQKLFQEITEQLGDKELTESSLSRMKYLKACVQESLRFSPLSIGLTRRTSTPMVMEGYRVPAGTNILFNTYYTNRLTDTFFKQAGQFNPDRWLRCPEQNRVDKYASLSFGHGPRSCIGQRFARLELQVLLCRLVQRYQLTYAGPEVRQVFKGFGEPNCQINIRFNLRK